jgi:molecular chaperone DnaJ
VSVTLEDVALGCERVIDVTRIVRCRTCDATGDATEGRTPCAACGGTGKSAQRRLFRSSCATCDGRGYAPTARCSRCSGEGRHPLEEKLKLRVPAGVATGQKLKLKGKGNEGGGRTPGAPGDLLVVIDVAEHPLFRRRGADLLVEVPITFVEAALGADVPVPLLVASTTIRVPPGTASGASFRLAGRGLPSPDGGARGDLHARVFVEIPERITSEQRSALVDLSRRLGGDAHPKRRAFDEAVRSRA